MNKEISKRIRPNTELENLCASLKDNFMSFDITMTAAAEDGGPGQQFDGKIILSKYPVEEKPTAIQH